MEIIVIEIMIHNLNNNNPKPKIRFNIYHSEYDLQIIKFVVFKSLFL